MAFDTELADRVREMLGPQRGVDEKPMFGGLAFLLNGNMCVAVSKDGGIMVRVPADDTENLLARAHVEPMMMAGREIRGWVRVTGDGVRTARQLAAWVTRGVDHAASLPRK